MKKSQRKVYESVIRDIAKIVKQRINESDEEPLFENGEFVPQNEKLLTLMDISEVNAVFSIQEQDIQYFLHEI